MTQQAKTQKQVHIIARYFLKKSGIVCYAVRSSNGVDIYHTCVTNGRASCTCPGFEKFHKCYHSAYILQLEDARQEQEIAPERADYLTQTHQATSDTIEHIESEQVAEKATTFAQLMSQYDYRRQLTPVAQVMEQAQAEMVQFDRDTTDAYDILAVTKVTAAMREAVEQVPSYVSRPQPETCFLCGASSKSGLCFRCGGC